MCAISEGSSETEVLHRLVRAFTAHIHNKYQNLVNWLIYRGSYMSVHVLLNLLNELGKSDKIGGLPSILLLFCNKFIKFQ